jgi:hypothetical protein
MGNNGEELSENSGRIRNLSLRGFAAQTQIAVIHNFRKI